MLRLINHKSLGIIGKQIHFELDGRYYLCLTQWKGLDDIIQCVIIPSDINGTIQNIDRLYEEDYVYNTWEQLNKAIIKFAYVMTGVTYNIKSFTFIDWLNELIFHKITAIKPCIATEKDIDKDIEQRIKGYCRKENIEWENRKVLSTTGTFELFEQEKTYYMGAEHTTEFFVSISHLSSNSEDRKLYKHIITMVKDYCRLRKGYKDDKNDFEYRG